MQANKQANKQARLTETTLNRFRDLRYVINQFKKYNKCHYYMTSDEMNKIEDVLNAYNVNDVLTFFDCLEEFKKYDNDDCNELFERYETINYISDFITDNITQIILYMFYISDNYYDLYDMIYINKVNFNDTKNLFSYLIDSYDEDYKTMKRLNKFYYNYYN